MSGLMGGSSSNTNVTPPDYTGLATQTSAYGTPVPIIFGTTRCTGQLVWYDNLTALANTSSSGKGGGRTNSSSYTYSVNLIFHLCEGPIGPNTSGYYSTTNEAWPINNVWNNSSSSGPYTASFSQVAYGEIGQDVWTAQASESPFASLTYSGYAYVGALPFNMFTSSDLPLLNFEVVGYLAGSAPNLLDADPSQVCYQLATNPQFGVGFPANRIGTLNTITEVQTVQEGDGLYFINPKQNWQYNLEVYDSQGPYQSVPASNGVILPRQYFVSSTGNYLFSSAQNGQSLTLVYAALTGLTQWSDFALASGLWVSPCYDTQQDASQMFDDLATYTHVEYVWSAGVLTAVPRGTVTVTGTFSGTTNSIPWNNFNYSWSPPSEPLFSLTDNDFMPNTGGGSTDDPIQIDRTRAADQYNQIKLTFPDRSIQYATNIVNVFDSALITRYGTRFNGNQGATIFSDIAAAQVSAQLLLQEQYIRNPYTFTVDVRFCALDPMDIVAVTDSNPNMGIVNQWVRITEIQENDDGSLTFTAEEYPVGTGIAAEYSVANVTPILTELPQNYNTPAPNVNTPVIFAAPQDLSESSQIEIWCAVSGSIPSSWGGCNVWISLDNETYTQVATCNGPGVYGLLTTELPVGPDPDLEDQLNVNLTLSQGSLTSVTETQANTNASVCYVDGEFISYTTATLTGPYEYNMGYQIGSNSQGYLRRGQYGSAIAPHAVGSQFALLNSAIVKIPMSADFLGNIAYVKFASFNPFGGGLQTIDSLPSYTIGPLAGPANNWYPTNLTVSCTLKTATVHWTNPSTKALSKIQIWRSGPADGSAIVTFDDNTGAENNPPTGYATKIAEVSYPSTSYVDTGLTPTQTYFYWIRPIDTAGTVGPWIDGYGPNTGVKAVILQTQAGDLGNGTITSPTQFLTGLSPISEGSSLPNPTTYSGSPAVFFNTTDLQLYRFVPAVGTTPASWTLAVPAINITGTLTSSQIGQYTVQAINLADDSVNTANIVAGAVSSTELANAAVTAVNLATGAVTTGAIAGGAVTASTIQAGAIGAIALAAGSVTATAIEAGAIGTVALAAGAVTAGTIAANTITTNQLAVGAVEAANIAVGSVNASKIAAHTITGDKLNVTFIQGQVFTATSNDGVGKLVINGLDDGNGYGPNFSAIDANGNNRVIMGRINPDGGSTNGVPDSDWGIQIWNAAGLNILNADGLGINTVGTSTIQSGAVSSVITTTAIWDGSHSLLNATLYFSGQGEQYIFTIDVTFSTVNSPTKLMQTQFLYNGVAFRESFAPNNTAASDLTYSQVLQVGGSIGNPVNCSVSVLITPGATGNTCTAININGIGTLR